MVDYSALSGIDDPDQVRVALVVNKQIAHVPLSAMGLQPLVAGLTDIAGLAVTDGNIIVGDGTNWVAESGATARTSLGLGSAATKELTSWVTYTPTFSALGTVTNISVWSRRVGDTLCLRGKFTPGTTTAAESRMTLGFNGTNGGITSDTTKVPSIQLAGYGIRNNQAATLFSHSVLIESNIGYVTFGVQSSTQNALTKANGNVFLISGEVFSFTAEVPISGW